MPRFHSLRLTQEIDGQVLTEEQAKEIPDTPPQGDHRCQGDHRPQPQGDHKGSPLLWTNGLEQRERTTDEFTTISGVGTRVTTSTRVTTGARATSKHRRCEKRRAVERSVGPAPCYLYDRAHRAHPWQWHAETCISKCRGFAESFTLAVPSPTP